MKGNIDFFYTNVILHTSTMIKFYSISTRDKEDWVANDSTTRNDPTFTKHRLPTPTQKGEQKWKNI